MICRVGEDGRGVELEERKGLYGRIMSGLVRVGDGGAS